MVADLLQQTVFVLAPFRDNPVVERLGCGFGLARATSYRYRYEGITALSIRPLIFVKRWSAPGPRVWGT